MNKAQSALIHKIVSALEVKKGMDIQALDVRELVSYTDYFLICSATSPAHVHALVENVEKACLGEGPLYVNRSKDDSWWILDFVDVVVHLFREEARRYYDLEGLWGDAKRIVI